MKSKHSSIIALVFFLFSSWIVAYTLAEDQYGKKDRETVLDKKVHIEKDLILDIPRVARWCDRLDLKKSLEANAGIRSHFSSGNEHSRENDEGYQKAPSF